MTDPSDREAELLLAFQELVSGIETKPDLDVEGFLAARPALAAELRALHSRWLRLERVLAGLHADAPAPRSTLLEPARRELDPRTAARLEALARMRPAEARYELGAEIARGGMGVVLRAKDRALGRELAIKYVLSRDGTRRAPDPAFVRRFLAEAERTSRLDHPGIVPVHDFGVDEAGEPFFTMRLVQGLDLGLVFELVRERRDGWSEVRALEVLLKVCDALAFAHSQGIVHRDLKPANVRVGRFGEVYVIDWGLARELEGPDHEHDAARGAARDPDSPLATLDGEVIGTPAFMAPEQARGELALVGRHSDVYSVGALLYQLLAGEVPYSESHASGSSRAVLAAVKAGPPPPLDERAPGAAPELAAICEKAMSREIADRYPDLGAMSEDLRAYLEGRVVAAHERGAWPVLRKWIARNRALVATSTIALLAVLGGLAAIAWIQARAREELATVADLRAPSALRAAAEELWPAVPELVPRIEHWLAEAEVLISRREQHRLALARLRGSGRERPAGDARRAESGRGLAIEIADLERLLAGRREDLQEIRSRASGDGARQGAEHARRCIARLERRLTLVRAHAAERGTRDFSDAGAAQREQDLVDLLAEIESFADPAYGLIADLRRRRELARSTEHRSLEEPAALWQAAIASIADPRECPLYRGLVVAPQLGLVPLGRDPRSGLWEFAHLASGDPPARGPDGRLALDEHGSVVLVLIPGGRFRMGADPLDDAAAPGGRGPGIQESPAHEVELAPYFLGKHELGQGQWERITGLNPSYFAAGTHFGGPGGGERTMTLLNPVERVSIEDAMKWLPRAGLALPTEAQWERAARAGTTSAWCCGDDPACLAGRLEKDGTRTNAMIEAGWPTPMPIDRLAPNPWGLHHVHGNVVELTRDSFWTSYRWPHRAGDGLQLAPDSRLYVGRGSALSGDPWAMRSSFRTDFAPDVRSGHIGLRVARALEPARGASGR